MKYIIYIIVLTLILYIPIMILTSLVGGIFGIIFSLIKLIWYVIFVKLWFISMPIVILSTISALKKNS